MARNRCNKERQLPLRTASLQASVLFNGNLCVAIEKWTRNSSFFSAYDVPLSFEMSCKGRTFCLVIEPIFWAFLWPSWTSGRPK